MSSIVCSEILFCTDRPLNALDAHGNPRCNHRRHMSLCISKTTLTEARFCVEASQPSVSPVHSATPCIQHDRLHSVRKSSSLHVSLVLGSGRVEGGRAVPRGPTPSEGAIPLCDRGWGRTGHPVRGLAVDRIVMECSWSFATRGQTIVPLGVATDLSGARCGSRVLVGRRGGRDKRLGRLAEWAALVGVLCGCRRQMVRCLVVFSSRIRHFVSSVLMSRVKHRGQDSGIAEARPGSPVRRVDGRPVVQAYRPASAAELRNRRIQDGGGKQHVNGTAYMFPGRDWPRGWRNLASFVLVTVCD
jgi:hypothetical protein